MKKIWQGKTVLILGLGQYPTGSGISAALYALKLGADLIVTDVKQEKDIELNVKKLKKFSNVIFKLGGHDLEDVRKADIIIPNPGVRSTSPEMQLAEKLNKKIETDITLFLRDCPSTVIGITGTRGKSTTSTLTSNIFRAAGKTVWLGGNILISPLNFIDKIKKTHYVVLELSSWQTEVLGKAGLSPHIACVTNIMRDHLNTYSSMDDYANAKAQLFENQTLSDFLILNGDDPTCRDWTRKSAGKVKLFTRKKEYASSAWILANSLFIKDKKEREVVKIPELKVRGEHIYMNMLAACLCASAAGIKYKVMKQALINFTGLPHRQEILKVKHGVTYVNDTTATTPDGTIAAIKAFSLSNGTLRIILGGADKELDFNELAKVLMTVKVDLVLLPGTAYEKLSAALKNEKVKFQNAKNLKNAFEILNKRAERGDVLILSPACASFGLFKNEFDRGEQFCALVKKA